MPGAALRQRGIGLPLSVAVLGEGAEKRAKGIVAVLRRSGFEPASDGAPARFALTVRLSGGEAACRLSDTLRGTDLAAKTVALPSGTAEDLAAFGRVVADFVFNAE